MKEEVFVAEQSFREATGAIEAGNYEEAREILNKIKIKDISRKYSILARLRIADTYFDEGSYEEAVVEYESFLDMYPYHKYASYAQYKLAMCYFGRIRTVDLSYSMAKKALHKLEELRRNYPRNPYMTVIENKIKACLNILADYEYYVGSFYYEKGSYQAAIMRYETLIRDYPDSNSVPEAMYYMGLSYENLGKIDRAVDTLTFMIDRYPTTELSSEAQKRIDSFDNQK